MLNTIVYVNGEFLKQKDAFIPFNDGGFQYGDGLFETIRFNNRKIYYVKKHLERLNNGLKILDLKLNHNEDEIILLLNRLIMMNELESGLLRLMVTRGVIEGTPWNYKGTSCIYISIRPLSKLPKEPVKIVFLKEKDFPIIRFSPAIKSMNYIGNMKAKKIAEELDAFEPVFINNNNYITECAIRNIFFIKNNVLLTPTLELGVLPGVMRSTILSIAKQIGMKVKETYIDYKNIDSMDESFISSTGIGLLPCFWENWNSQFIITKKIAKKLNQKIN